jgi:hypothetical protein
LSVFRGSRDSKGVRDDKDFRDSKDCRGCRVHRDYLVLSVFKAGKECKEHKVGREPRVLWAQ